MRALRLLLVLAALMAPAPAAAQLAHEVKAAFLYQFLSYVEWPDESFSSPNAPLVIGVVGSDEVCAALAEILQGRTAQGRPVEVRRLKESELPANVHVLFVGRSESGVLAKAAGRRGQLVVSEDDHGLDHGAMINLAVMEDHVRFQVAPEAAERNGLRISSRLLALAQYVKRGRG